MQGQQPHPRPNRQINRGSYNCGRCGLPKKGHNCHTTPAAASSSPISTIPPPPPPRHHPYTPPALSSDSDNHNNNDVEELISPESQGSGGDLPASCLWEVLRRLPPAEVLSAAMVCREWRHTTRRIWRAAVEVRVRVPAKTSVGLIGSFVKKCPGLIKLSLRMESDVEATMLACIAFSCPNLQALEICTSDSSVNRITGDELGRFVAEKRGLTSLKMEGCSNLGAFSLSSTSLSVIWLTNLHSITKMVFNCLNLREISLDFSCEENECTDLIALVDGLGRNCPRLQNIHISSFRLSHVVVLSLAAANLRRLRMLSLVLGTQITDASVAAIASSYPDLELLDLSGSSISDSGIGMICNAMPDTLSKLLLALCPNITSSGIQFATAQLPLLELLDCGMTVCDSDVQDLPSEETNDCELQRTPSIKRHLMYQKLIVKHSQLKKLSLWGCSGLDALYLNCPQLNDLNLNSCRNLNPARLLIQCPNLETVHVSDCQDMLIEILQNQVCTDLYDTENCYTYKRLADSSKRVQLPHFLSHQAYNDDKDGRTRKRKCTVLMN